MSITIQIKCFPHSDPKAQPSGGPKADFSDAFRPTGNGGEGADPPLTIILINSRLTVRRPLGSLTLAYRGSSSGVL